MANATCFDAPTLRDYLLGRLPDEQCDVIAAHVEACATCEATVAQLDRDSDTLTNGLRLPVAAVAMTATEPASEAVLRQALEQVQSCGPSPSAQSSEVSRVRSPVLRDYRLLEPLGSGGMGTVFKAVHTRLDRLVAVKLLPARRLGDEQAVARFQREMRVIGQLSHPAIVQATDAGEVDGTHFLVMEFVEGLDLNRIAKACGPLSIADACEITRQAALGLEYAHQQGIVHRDIKPGNLMLSRETKVQSREPDTVGASSHGSQLSSLDSRLSVKILDLGLALLSGVQAPVDELTTVGQLMGTLDYMAPEQLEDSHLVDSRADIYALAATLFRLLTGDAPYANDRCRTPLQKLRALAMNPAPRIGERRTDLPSELCAIIDRALSRDPAARFASMSDFAAALAPWCGGHELARLSRHATQAAAESVEHVFNVLDPKVTPNPPPRGISRMENSLKSQRHVENVPHVQSRSSNRVAAVGLIAAVTVLLGLIVIQTNQGQLVIETARPGVEVRVKRSGKIVEQLEITTKSKTTRLAAGEYEIEIAGDADNLRIDHGQFTLRRGDTVIAKISEAPPNPVAGETNVAPPIAAAPPADIVDRNAKGMETFETLNPDVAEERQVRRMLGEDSTVAFSDMPLTDCLIYLTDLHGITILLDEQDLQDNGIATDFPITLALKGVQLSVVLDVMLQRLGCTWIIDQGQLMVMTKAKAQAEGQLFVTRMYPVGRLLPGMRRAVARLIAQPPQPKRQGAAHGGGGFFQVLSKVPTAVPLIVRPTILCQLGGFGGGLGGEWEFAGGGIGVAQDALPTVEGHFGLLLTSTLSHPWLNVEGEGGTFELVQNTLVVRQTQRAQADIESLLRTVEAAFLRPLNDAIEIRPAGYAGPSDFGVGG